MIWMRYVGAAALLGLSAGCGEEANNSAAKDQSSPSGVSAASASGASSMQLTSSSVSAAPSNAGVLNPAPIDTGAAPVDGHPNDYWSKFCVATFTADTAVPWTSDVDLFTAHAGDRFLMFDFDETPIGAQAQLAYLAPGGPFDFTIQTPGTQGTAADLPITSNCSPDARTGYWAVFADVTLYETAELTTELCKLVAGRAEPVGTKIPQYGAVSTDLFAEGPVTMEVSLLGYEKDCNNAQTGFFSAPVATVLGVQTHLVPFGRVIGPE